jgi:hypothetical protein
MKASSKNARKIEWQRSYYRALTLPYLGAGFLYSPNCQVGEGPGSRASE